MARGGTDQAAPHDDSYRSPAKWGSLAVGSLSALAGGLLIGIGVYGLLNPLGASMVPMTLPALAIATGSAIVLLALIGCFGTLAEHRKILWFYFLVMAALILMQLVVGIAPLSTRGNTMDQLVDRRWDYLYENQPRELRRIEEQYQCCGLKDLDDRAWPKTDSDRKRCSRNKDFGYTRPCMEPVRDEFSGRQKVFGIVVCTLAALELLGLIPVYYLVASLPTTKQREEELLDEHRQLLARTGGGSGGGGYYGVSRDVERGHGSAVPVQHPTGGPAGSYPYAGSRPGSRAG